MKTTTTLDLNAYESTRAAVEADPTAGRGSFRTITSWTDGARARWSSYLHRWARV